MKEQIYDIREYRFLIFRERRKRINGFFREMELVYLYLLKYINGVLNFLQQNLKILDYLPEFLHETYRTGYQHLFIQTEIHYKLLQPA